MKIQDLSDRTKKIIESVPKGNIEKFVFKILLGVWIAVILVGVVVGNLLGRRDYIQEKIIENAAGTGHKLPDKSDFAKYESLFTLVKYPEAIEQYTHRIKRDPFLEYSGEAAQLVLPFEHDFELKSIERVPLPMVYRGYIELPDRIIGQLNWYDATRFVRVGSAIDGYKIRDITKKKLEATDEGGQNIEFELNKPVFSDKLQAILYDNVSGKTFSVRVSTVIGAYEVTEITPRYVILLSEGKETKLEK